MRFNGKIGSKTSEFYVYLFVVIIGGIINALNFGLGLEMDTASVIAGITSGATAIGCAISRAMAKRGEPL